MPETIISVEHSHGGYDGLVLEVGKPLPPHYQDGRRPGLLVKSIQGNYPVICILSDDDKIFIAGGKVRSFTRQTSSDVDADVK